MVLKQKLQSWKNEGFIDESTVEKILAFESKQPKPVKIPLLLIIGLIFFSLAVFSFIAANWQAMPDVLRIFLTLSVMWLFYILGHFSEMKKFGQPIIFRLIGLAMFAASIVVTVQTYHFSLYNSFLPWAIFIAALGHYWHWRQFPYAIVAFVFGAQVLFTSVVTLGWFEWGAFLAVSLAWFYFSKTPISISFSWILLFGAGLTLWSVVEYDNVLWPIWSLFGVVAFIHFFPEKEQIVRPLYLMIGGIQLLVYLAILGETQLSFIEINIVESITLAIVGAALLAFSYFRFKKFQWVAALSLIGLLLYDESAIGLAILAEVIALAYLINEHRKDRLLAPGFVFFILVQFVLYFIYAWGRMDVSLFFLIGALLLFALSGIAWRINKKKVGVSS
ncbi:DUF2157 domain-containing protein [Paenisporosarcina sp. FSL H8-0542]|uniref:DUF2157 domain-containing protein n=1 Tax=unclassified Paenisporosarcina TaxID=2642018 RepID=UPI00034E6EB1|nr:DUF2157 domain-containing protein [Paenisporosarcina sp. HGH0030]EPD50244.1 hypothetical protein HMPREF1210_02815 [Paenisporosarcina sp. HGH0030]